MSTINEKIPAHSTTHQDLTAETLANDASGAEDVEHAMTISQGFKLYPKAVGWSILLSTAVIMEGYDTMLVGNFYSQPAFQKAFGIPDGKGGYQIASIWQSGLSSASSVGCIIGLFFAGTSAERFGYRKTMIGALTFITGSIFVVFFADTLKMLLVGEILCGLSWGIFQTVTMTYASEVCPVPLRCYLTTYVNL
jgi:SP family general alpha glucoside:H+ symporter-like MFS transporter